MISIVLTLWFAGTLVLAGEKDLEIQGKKVISLKPPFTLLLPSELQLIHSSSFESPKENSLTRVYLLIKEKNKQVEEILIFQIGDKTNPQAGPISTPPLKPYTEKRMYSKGKIKKGEWEGDYLTQLMGWNPNAPSLQPIIKKEISIPSHWALQGQFLFNFQGEHAVYIRYSKDAKAFGLKVSEQGDRWDQGSISGNEKKGVEIFQKIFMDMIHSIHIKNP